MDPRDLPPMKTGFDNLIANEVNDALVENVSIMIMTYADGALRTATTYISHGTRTVVTTEDLKRAMMLEVFLMEKRPDLITRAEEIKKELFDNSDEDDEEDENVMVDEEEAEPFTPNTCSCALCASINNIYQRWEVWTPTSRVQQILKKHIDLM
tara:strand:- start:1022 stop:1483 length:462 start_codon:yes stop_codon:yes gene_type:complete